MRRLTTALFLGIAVLVPAFAAASPQSDFDAVYSDWRPDHVITQCRWTQAQLQNAYDVASSSPDFQYETNFQDSVYREISRWKAGGCAGVSPAKITSPSPLTGVHVVAVHGRGGARSEYVRLRNLAATTISFRKASLRNAGRGRATFPAAFKLRKGRTATVHVGCARGHTRASFAGSVVWLCRRSALLRDRGDVARLADGRGVIVSQRPYGSLRRRAAF